MDPLISIILPTRNRLESIGRTVDRILGQSVTDWELVISDNASDQEGKKAYLQELANRDGRVRLFEQEQNIGIHKNWRYCIERTRGRYYIAVTDDDWWGENHYLETLLAKHDGSTGAVFPNMTLHRVDSGLVRERVLSAAYAEQHDQYGIYEALVKDGKGAIMIGLIDTHVVPKADIIEAIDNDRVFRIEAVGMHRIARRHRVVFAEEVTYHHPEYSENYSKKFSTDQRAQDCGIVYFQLLDEIRRAARDDSGFGSALEAHWEGRMQALLPIVKELDLYKDRFEKLAINRVWIETLQSEVAHLKSGERSTQSTPGNWLRRIAARLKGCPPSGGEGRNRSGE